MRRVHIIGRKNHGKTTLVSALVEELVARGLRVGTIKHTHHAHELDAPGKDSHRHRLAGSRVVGILSPAMNAVFWAPQEPTAAPLPSTDRRGRYEEFAPHYAGCDVVLVEGDTLADAPRIEVWRAAAGDAPLAARDPTIVAVVSDDHPQVAAPIWPRSDLPALAERILALVAGS